MEKPNFMPTNRYKSLLKLDFLFKALNRDLKLVFISNVVGAFGDGLYYFILPLYFRTELGATPAEVGILFTVLCLAAALTPIPGGILADKYDRKKVMVLGWLLWTPVPLIFSMAGHWTQALPAVFMYGVLLGVPASSAYIATSAQKERMTVTFTTISFGWWLGYIFSPALGGYLSTLFGMRTVFFLASVFYALCAVVLSLISSQHAVRQPPKPTQSSLSPTPFKRKKILLWALLFGAIMFIEVLVRPLVPQFLEDIFLLDNFRIGVLGSITFLGSAVLALCLGRVGDRWRKAGAVSVATIFCCVSTIILISFNNFPTLGLASFLMGPSYVIWSLIGAVTGSMAPEASRARWMSVPETAAMIGAFFAPYLGGVMYQSWAYGPFIFSIIITPILSVLALTKPLKEI